jgi:hypothetical protein
MLRKLQTKWNNVKKKIGKYLFKSKRSGRTDLEGRKVTREYKDKISKWSQRGEYIAEIALLWFGDISSSRNSG